MNFNWSIIGDKIFGILKGSGFTLQMFDKTGAKTLDPHEATRFFATIASNDPELEKYSILIGVHDENHNSHVDIKTPNLDNNEDFDFIHKLKNSIQRNVGDREGLSVNWFKFDHAITPKDEVVNNIVESKDISKPFGSTKSSYQRVGNSKIIIRHTDAINEEKKGSRWRHVRAIFVENALGERLMYPHMHIAGARAMARHFSNNGVMHDQIGEAIQQLSSDYMDLKRSAKMIRATGDESKTTALRESLHKINKDVKKLSGSRGYVLASGGLKEQNINEDSNVINKIYEELLEKCMCERDSNDAATLLVAAKYLSTANLVEAPTVNFTSRPDLTSECSNYPDQKDRMAWQIEQLAECVDDDMLRSKLTSAAGTLRTHGVMDPDDVELVKMVFKASKGIKHEPEVPVVDPGLDRIKTLSGI